MNRFQIVKGLRSRCGDSVGDSEARMPSSNRTLPSPQKASRVGHPK